MEGYVYVDPMAIEQSDLQAWLEEAATFVQTLPPKPARGKSVQKGR